MTISNDDDERYASPSTTSTPTLSSYHPHPTHSYPSQGSEEEEEEDDDDDDMAEDEEEEDDEEDDVSTTDATALAVPPNPSHAHSSTLFLTATPSLLSSKSNLYREIGHSAIWSLSTAKPGNGVEQLRDSSYDTYWQSDGGQPHYMNLQFSKRMSFYEICFYLDYNLDESYTPKEISVKVGMTFHDLVQVRVCELKEPVGWIVVPLWESVEEEDMEDGLQNMYGGGTHDMDPYVFYEEEADEEEEEDPLHRAPRTLKRRKKKRPIRGHFIQICISSMHQNGRDTHIRQVKIFGPRNQEELSKPSWGRSTSSSGNSKSQRGEDDAWICGVPKFQTVGMSQFSTIR